MAQNSDEKKKKGDVIVQDRNMNEIKWLKFPFEIVDIQGELSRQLLADFKGDRTGYVQVGSKKWFFPSCYKKNAEIYYNFQPRPDDIWVVSFPRSGTTWTQEMVWLLANNLDYHAAANTTLAQRFPFLEFDSFCHPDVIQELIDAKKDFPDTCETIRKVASPAWKLLDDATGERRLIKTHLPFELLPPNLFEVGAKIIYIARNPKDVIVSYYHLCRLFKTQGYFGDFPTYWQYFKQDLRPWTPFWEHLKQGWQRRDTKNFLFMFYEDLSKDLNLGIKKMAAFLGKSYTEEEYEQLAVHLNIKNFRQNKSVNGEDLLELGYTSRSEEGFVRKGVNGGWKNYFNGQLETEVEQWIEENLKDTDLKLPETTK